MLKTNEHETVRATSLSQTPERVILTGFRATGKSIVGERLAGLIGYRFLDTDIELVSKIKCSVAKFVTRHGWPVFRELEQELLERLLLMDHVVIATGGGAVLHKKEWEQLRKNSLVVWLKADIHTIRERLRIDPVSQEQRPPLSGDTEHEEVESILAEREQSYMEGSDMAIDTSDKSPGEIAALIKEYIIQTEKA